MINKLNKSLSRSLVGIALFFSTFSLNAQDELPSHLSIYLNDGKCISTPIEQVDSIKYANLSYEEYLSISLTKGGTLASALGEYDPSAIRSLQISGNINEEDIKYIKYNMPSLTTLNLWSAALESNTDGMTSIYNEFPSWAFAEQGDIVTGIQSLREVSFPEKTLTIGAHAFENCAFIHNLIIPESVETIGESAFSGCHSISSLELPSTLLTIGDNAFNDNFCLRHVTIHSENVPQFGSLAFSNIYPGAVLTVPKGSGKDYLYSPWSYYFRIYQEGDEETEISQESACEEFKFITLNGEEPFKIDETNNFILFKTIYSPGEVDQKNMCLTLLPQYGYSVSVNGERFEGSMDVNMSKPITLSVSDPKGEMREFIVAVCFGDIPTIYVNTKDGAPIDSKEKYLKGTEIYVLNSDNDCCYVDANIKGRGNSSWTLQKKPYTVKLNKKDKFAGFAKHKTFALVANHSDKTLLRNELSYEMARDIYNSMSWNPHTLMVHLVVNGSYDGVYSLTETSKLDANRIDIPSIEDCPSIDEVANYGFLIEANQRLDEILNITTKHGNKFTLKEPDGEDMPEEYKDYITQKLLEAEDILYSHASKDDDNYFGKHFEIDSFVDWYLINEIAKNQDARYGNSCFLYYDPKDSLWHAGPVWDFDIGYGNINYGGTDNPDGFHVNTARWPYQFFKYPEFVDKVKARWNEKKDELQNFFMNIAIDKAAAIEPEAAMNFKRWNILGKYVWPNAEGYQDRDTYQSEVDFLIKWVKERIEWLDININAL